MYLDYAFCKKKASCNKIPQKYHIIFGIIICFLTFKGMRGADLADICIQQSAHEILANKTWLEICGDRQTGSVFLQQTRGHFNQQHIQSVPQNFMEQLPYLLCSSINKNNFKKNLKTYTIYFISVNQSFFTI